MSEVVPAPAFGALALHGLAHLPFGGHASLFDARYVAWARETLGEACVEPLAEDAARIAAEVSRAGAGEALSWLPRLHREIDAALRVSDVDLAALDEARVDDAHALRALRAIDPVGVEWLRADLACAARPFERAFRADASALARACESVSSALASAPVALRPEKVFVARALGARGRAYADSVWVGVPSEQVDASTVAVVALHEEAVRRGAGAYATREWGALGRLARGLTGSPLAPAHAAWLASLDLGSVIDAPALALDAELRHALHTQPHARAEQLRSLAADDG